MEGGAFLEASAAAVRHGASGFLHQQAVGGRGLIDAAGQGLPSEDEVVRIVVVTAEREFESALAGEGTVAAARVAAVLGERRNDVVAEVPGTRRFDFHLHDDGLVQSGRGDGGFTRPSGADDSGGIDGGYGRVRGSEGRLGREVGDDATVLFPHDEELLRAVRPGDRDFGRIDAQIGGDHGANGEEEE